MFMFKRSFVLFLIAVVVGILYSTSVTPNIAASGYDRDAAVRYADQWVHDRNSGYPNYAGLDCTNFASQVMAAGGLSQITGDYNDSDSSLWYVYSDWLGWHNSKTWSAADWLNQHSTIYDGSRFQSLSSSGDFQGGDILIIRWRAEDVIPVHTRVIIGNGISEEYVEGGRYGRSGIEGLLASQHDTDRKRIIWDDGFQTTTGFWMWRVNG